MDLDELARERRRRSRRRARTRVEPHQRLAGQLQQHAPEGAARRARSSAAATISRPRTRRSRASSSPPCGERLRDGQAIVSWIHACSPSTDSRVEALVQHARRRSSHGRSRASTSTSSELREDLALRRDELGRHLVARRVRRPRERDVHRELARELRVAALRLERARRSCCAGGWTYVGERSRRARRRGASRRRPGCSRRACAASSTRSLLEHVDRVLAAVEHLAQHLLARTRGSRRSSRPARSRSRPPTIVPRSSSHLASARCPRSSRDPRASRPTPCPSRAGA